MEQNAPIGIFDSGIGGLTVVKEMQRLLPSEHIIYVGDTKRAPYGSRDPVEIIAFMHQILRFFKRQKVKMAVIACNTMTAYGYQEAKEHYDFAIIGMNSGVREAIAVSPHKKIGVIATEGTVRNTMHKQFAEKIDPAVAVYAKACPDFVPLIENGCIAGEKIEQAAARYLDFFQGTEINALILGCTHYPLIGKVIQKNMGSQVNLINPARATAKDAVNELKKVQGLNKDNQKGTLRMCFSADIEKARRMVSSLLSMDQVEFNLIQLVDES